MVRFRRRKRKRFLESLSEKMSLQNNRKHVKYKQEKIQK